ncbi:MAG: AraC family transcriptional regulator [Sneathiella sp.]
MMHEVILSKPNVDELSRSWRVDEGFDLVQSRFTSHSFPKHSHDFYGVYVMLEGVKRFNQRGENITVVPGDVVIVNPGEVHDGHTAVEGRAFEYRSCLFSQDRLRELLDEVNPKGNLPVFKGPLLEDKQVGASILAAHQANNQAHPDQLQLDEQFFTNLAGLIYRHSDAGLTLKTLGNDKRVIAASLDYMNDNYAEKITLDQLSVISKLPKFQYLRQFKRVMGLSPHAYLNQYRLQKAFDQLRRGQSAAQAAAQVGYFDQAHFIKSFKAMYGVTPMAFLNSVA